MCVYVCVCVCRGQWTASSASPASYIFRNMASGPPLASPFHLRSLHRSSAFWDCSICYHVRPYMGPGNLISGPHACIASTRPTKPSPRSPWTKSLIYNAPASASHVVGLTGLCRRVWFLRVFWGEPIPFWPPLNHSFSIVCVPLSAAYDGAHCLTDQL